MAALKMTARNHALSRITRHMLQIIADLCDIRLSVIYHNLSQSLVELIIERRDEEAGKTFFMSLPSRVIFIIATIFNIATEEN